MTPHSAAMADRAPDRVMQIGGTVIKIVAPSPMSEAERQIRHQNIVRAVARCLEDSSKKAESR